MRRIHTLGVPAIKRQVDDALQGRLDYIIYYSSIAACCLVLAGLAYRYRETIYKWTDRLTNA